MSEKAELLQKKKKEQKKKKYIVISCVTAIVVVFFVLFLRIPYFQVTHISFSGLETIEEASIEKRVETLLSGSYLWVLPKRNIFLIHKKTIIADLAATYSRIDTIKIHKQLHTVDIRITERIPTSIWCQHPTDTACYFVHTDGTIFDTAGVFSNPLYFMYSTPVSDRATPIGQHVLSDTDFVRITQIKDTVKDYGMTMYGYGLYSENEEYFYITPITSGTLGAYIKTRKDQSSQTIVSNLVTALKTDVLRKEKEHNFLNTEYIDLRFDGKVIYKLKNNDI